MILQVGSLFLFSFAVNFRVWNNNFTTSLKWILKNGERQFRWPGSTARWTTMPGPLLQHFGAQFLMAQQMAEWSQPSLEECPHPLAEQFLNGVLRIFRQSSISLAQAILCMCQLRAGHELSDAIMWRHEPLLQALSCCWADSSAFCGWLLCLDHGITCSCRTP